MPIGKGSALLERASHIGCTKPGMLWARCRVHENEKRLRGCEHTGKISGTW